MIKITALSDLHGEMPKLPGGDLLIVAGDCTARDMPREWTDFFKWVQAQPYDKIVLIAGNHDGFLEETLCEQGKLYWEDPEIRLEYLCDASTTYKGYKIYGFPWTPMFCNWHFMLDLQGRAEKADLIPLDTDILVSHGPPKFILDQVKEMDTLVRNCGCSALREAVERVKPRYHIFGHIHSQGAMIYNNEDTCFMNVAYMDEQYMPTGNIRNFELEVKEGF